MSSFLNKELVTYQNRLFWIYRKIRESAVKSERITELRDYWRCDIVLRQKSNDGTPLLFYMVEIPEAEVIEYTKY